MSDCPPVAYLNLHGRRSAGVHHRVELGASRRSAGLLFKRRYVAKPPRSEHTLWCPPA